MNPIEIMTGKENPTSGESSLLCMCYHEGRKRFLGDMIGTKVGEHEVMKITDPCFEPALAGHAQEIAGRWVRQSFLLPEGLILVITGNKRFDWRDAGRPGSIILRMRGKAALRQLEFTTLQLSVSTRGTVVAAKGRFDVLSPEEARTYGMIIEPERRDYYTQASVIGQFVARILEPELSVKQSVNMMTVKTEFGEQQVAIRKRTRSL